MMIDVMVGSGVTGLGGRATGTAAQHRWLPKATLHRCVWIGKASSLYLLKETYNQHLCRFLMKGPSFRDIPHSHQPGQSCTDKAMIVQFLAGVMRRQEQCRKSRRTSRAIRPSAGGAARAPFGLLLECDGVLVDTHKDGHRVAFNSAFSVSPMPYK